MHDMRACFSLQLLPSAAAFSTPVNHHQMWWRETETEREREVEEHVCMTDWI